MSVDKLFCPGSKTIKEPTPEYLNCPKCGSEVEVWTNEVSYPCSHCGTRVFREQRPGCIDWCPHAKECIGPDVYKSLKSAQAAAGAAASPVDVLSREHDEGIKKIGLLRTATLCIRAGARAPDSAAQTIERALGDLNNVLQFTDNELKIHFRNEEDILFPMLEKHIGQKGSPTRMLLEEHASLWKERDQLRDKLEEFKTSNNGHRAETAGELYEAGSRFAGLLREHIAKENESLIPIARKVLNSKEMEEFSARWQG